MYGPFCFPCCVAAVVPKLELVTHDRVLDEINLRGLKKHELVGLQGHDPVAIVYSKDTIRKSITYSE